MGKSGGTSCPNDDEVIGQCNLVTERDVTEHEVTEHEVTEPEVTERDCQSLLQNIWLFEIYFVILHAELFTWVNMSYEQYTRKHTSD